MDIDPVAMYEVIKIFLMPNLLASIRTAVDLELFSLGESVFELGDIATKKNVDPVLLRRILRVLCASGIFEQFEGQRYGPTAMSRAFGLQLIQDWAKTTFDITLPVLNATPNFLKSTSYRNPDGIPQSITKSVLGSDYFEYLNAHPELAKIFDSAMKVSEMLPPDAIPEFPYVDKVGPTTSETEQTPLFLDIGGGHGHYVRGILEKIPDLPCEFIVQDLGPSTSTIDFGSPKIKGMVYDFFEPQPIKDARIYSFRRVFHDWSDTASRKILANTTKAMKKGYSTLLIQDCVLPEKGCAQFDALVDFQMATITGMERTEDQWRNLLESEGLKIVKIWAAKMGSLSIVEAELA